MYVDHLCARCPRRPEEGIRPLEAELQVLATTWVLGIEGGSSRRVTISLTYEPSLFPAPHSATLLLQLKK